MNTIKVFAPLIMSISKQSDIDRDIKYEITNVGGHSVVLVPEGMFLVYGTCRDSSIFDKMGFSKCIALENTSYIWARHAEVV